MLGVKDRYMIPIELADQILTLKVVQKYAAKYDGGYDENHYFPFIEKGKEGDPDALRRLTD
jgi:hypothetical protein